ncbi:hypothetical protein [Nitrosopumilus ureiphilus]|uniref:Uncharacterized protein n=1 Tax=Nitrosopumilus ureiphilus TaxID=1470067 RepID=A0A7D5M5C5_9ARCH|nr:hypothetical protein [Nitrosopumilus ureiphilus]QLH06933.1 hypothetical protein C5F50_07500 [Nitrosopumilus ureiphilus]
MTVEEETGVIVILDALGTKGIWNRVKDVKKYVESWEELTSSWKENYESPGENDDFQNKLIAFSDTIIIKNTGKNLSSVLTAAAHNVALVMLEAISQGIYLRGCMSVGQIFSSDKMIIGKAIDEAAEYHTMPNWAGISVSPSVYNMVKQMRKEKKLNGKYNETIFTDYDIPLKIGVEKGIAINYPSRLDLGWGKNVYKENFGVSKKHELVEIFENELNSITDLGASLKIRNTIEFLKYVSCK